MAEPLSLVSKSPAADMLPVEIGEMRLREVLPEAITWVAPFKGQEATVSAQLRDLIGVGLPPVGRASEGGRVLWSGLGEYLVLGPPVALTGAAMADQSDGFAVLALEGPLWADVLARLTPLDLRPRAVAIGSCARSLLGHMPCLFHRTGADHVEMLVQRSMVGTAIHEITQAMQNVS